MWHKWCQKRFAGRLKHVCVCWLDGLSCSCTRPTTNVYTIHFILFDSCPGVLRSIAGQIFCGKDGDVEINTRVKRTRSRTFHYNKSQTFFFGRRQCSAYMLLWIEAISKGHICIIGHTTTYRYGSCPLSATCTEQMDFQHLNGCQNVKCHYFRLPIFGLRLPARSLLGKMFI